MDTCTSLSSRTHHLASFLSPLPSPPPPTHPQNIHLCPELEILMRLCPFPNQQRTLNKVLSELRCRNFVNNHRLSIQISAKRAKMCMQCVHVPTELIFCIPPLVVGYVFFFFLIPSMVRKNKENWGKMDIFLISCKKSHFYFPKKRDPFCTDWFWW